MRSALYKLKMQIFMQAEYDLIVVDAKINKYYLTSARDTRRAILYIYFFVILSAWPYYYSSTILQYLIQTIGQYNVRIIECINKIVI